MIADSSEGKIPLSYDYCIQAQLQVNSIEEKIDEENNEKIGDSIVSLGQNISEINLIDVSVSPTSVDV